MIRACDHCGQKNRIPPRHLANEGRCGQCGRKLPAQAAPLSVNAAEFRQITEAARVPVLVDFWASWCGPCRMAAPHLEKVATDWQGRALVLKVDTEENPEIAREFKVSSIPHFVVLKEGRSVMQQVGLVDHRQMGRWLEQAS